MTDDRMLRTQAIQLTQDTFKKIDPAPLRGVHQVAPIVYNLLANGVLPDVIAQALIIARAHTVTGIDYALRQIMPPADKTVKPKYREIEQSAPFNPSEAEKAAAKREIARAREFLHGPKNRPA